MADNDDNGGGRGERVTNRADRVTDRGYRDKQHKRPTDRVREPSPRESMDNNRIQGELQAGDWVADRYKVVEGPLGATFAGEAEVYRCTDEQAGGREIALKLYFRHTQPRFEIMAQLAGLSNQYLVALETYGEFNGRFYEVQEYCAGGTAADHVRWTQDKLGKYLPAVLEGLNYCHSQGIIHRDIKPQNLLFRDSEHRTMVIGDFGISSIGFTGVTRTRNYTPDYAAPELINSLKISGKTDYYALGITLMHLLRGESPFAHDQRDAIMAAHLFGKLPFPDDVSPEFLQLLKGLTQHDPDNRWGYKQVVDWFQGNNIVDDKGQPWREAPPPTSAAPDRYPGCTAVAITTPQEMAANLDRFEAAYQLFHGKIGDWIFDRGFPKIAQQIDKIRDNDTARPELAVFKLKYVLDSNQPLMIGQQEMGTIPQLAEQLGSQDENTLQTLENFLWGEYLEAWIIATRPLPDDPDNDELAAKIAAIRNRLRQKHRRLALTTLLYTLDPGRPFRFAPDAEVKAPADLTPLLRRNPKLARPLQASFNQGTFEEWLRAVEITGWQAMVAYIQECHRQYGTDERLRGYALAWYFCPSVPFPFDNEFFTDPEALAHRIDRDADSRRKGMALLDNGWLRAWLVALGLAAAESFDNALSTAGVNSEIRLEAVLQLLAPNLNPPRASRTIAQLDFGLVDREKPKTRAITIKNIARGYLYGSVGLKHSDRGVRIEPIEFSGTPTEIWVTVDAQGRPAGTRESTTLVVNTNGGELEIPINYRVSAPFVRIAARCLIAGAVVGTLLGLIRLWVGNSFKDQSPNAVLDWVTAQHSVFSGDPLVSGGPFFMPLFFLVVGFGVIVYYITRHRNR